MSYYQVISDDEVVGTYEFYEDAESFRLINGYDSIRYYDGETCSWVFNVTKPIK